jgi:hypothetical protein
MRTPDRPAYKYLYDWPYFPLALDALEDVSHLAGKKSETLYLGQYKIHTTCFKSYLHMRMINEVISQYHWQLQSFSYSKYCVSRETTPHNV